MKRPPSYSDSYYVLGGHHSHTELVSLSEKSGEKSKEPIAPVAPIPVAPRIYLFLIKSAIHIFLISVFETIFFFQYVSISENNGILKTINTYYQPLISNCSGWTPVEKTVIENFLTQNMNYTVIEQNGILAKDERNNSNSILLYKSLSASGICLACIIIGGGYLRWKQIPVRWSVVFGENLSMVILLGLYEFIFFQYIIYNYSTLSTPELNAYLLKGFYDCSV